MAEGYCRVVVPKVSVTFGGVFHGQFMVYFSSFVTRRLIKILFGVQKAKGTPIKA